MSSSLARAIVEARDVLRRNRDGALPLCVRRALWRALDQAGARPLEPRRDTWGHRRRVLVDEAIVRRLRPIWQERFPHDPRLEEALAAAHGVVFDGTDKHDARRVLGELWTLGDDLSRDALTASHVAHAAASLIATALEDKTPQMGLAEHIDDDDLDPYWWETAFWAALAEAGGEPGAEASDAAARRMFWSWYINEAVPEAAASDIDSSS